MKVFFILVFFLLAGCDDYGLKSKQHYLDNKTEMKKTIEKCKLKNNAIMLSNDKNKDKIAREFLLSTEGKNCVYANQADVEFRPIKSAKEVMGHSYNEDLFK